MPIGVQQEQVLKVWRERRSELEELQSRSEGLRDEISEKAEQVKSAERAMLIALFGDALPTMNFIYKDPYRQMHGGTAWWEDPSDQPKPREVQVKAVRS